MTTTSIIATTPREMQEASAVMTGWVDVKLAGANREADLALETIGALQRAGTSIVSANRLFRLAKKRILFYEKIKAALAKGYHIIPPFAVQRFAIRVDTIKHAPAEQEGDTKRARWLNEQTPDALPAGAGEYVSPVPDRAFAREITKKDYQGKENQVALYRNTAWMKPDIPLLAQIPVLIERTAGALEEKIFDALGIAPAYRSADPIIVGQIEHWRKGANPVTFFVAWWLDERDL